MRRPSLVRLAWLALAAGACADAPGRPADHVVLVSIDGLVPEMARAAEDHGVAMPELAALRESGVLARGVVGLYPTLTYPSHTARSRCEAGRLTGRRPDHRRGPHRGGAAGPEARDCGGRATAGRPRRR